MNSQLWWYTARAGGLVSWVLAAASVLWGLSLSGRAIKSVPRPNWQLDLHRFLGGLAVVFTGVHVAGLVADSYTHFGLTQVLVPFTGTWHPAAVAAGVVAMYLLVAVEVTSLLRKRLSKRVWRMTHFLSFPLFALGTIHMLTAGTDRNNGALRTLVVLVVSAVAGLTGHRVVASTRPQEHPRRSTRVPASLTSR